MEELIDEIINTSGFYKLDGGLLYAPNFVLNQNYELRKETQTDHTYPIDGWYWFENEAEAKLFFGIVDPEEEELKQQEL